MVGRESELSAVAAVRMQGVGVILTGASGVGKTRLAQEMLADAVQAGHESHWVVATRSAASIPFGAVSHLIPNGEVFGGDLLTVLRRVSDDIRARSARRPVVLGVDDAHLLDDASAALVHHVITHSLAFVVLTMRRGERSPDAIGALTRHERVHRVGVRVLTPTAVDDLIDRTLAGPVDGVTRHEIRSLAEGNPMFLRELLREGAASGALRQSEGVWRWTGPSHDSPLLADLVAARLEELDPEVRTVLEMVACGEPLSVGILDALTDLDTLDATWRTGLLTAEQSHRRAEVRLAHPLYGEVIRATLPVSRARSLWGQLAGALTGTPMRRRDDALLAGVWQMQSAAPSSPEVLVRAARQALARFDMALAERLCRAAHAAGGGWDVDHTLAEILELRGRYDEAAAVLPGSPPSGAADAAAGARWASTRAAILYWGLNRASDAERVLDAAGAGAGADLAEATRCLILLFEGRGRQALAAGLPILERHDAPDEAVLRAAAGVTASAALLGRFDRAMSVRAMAEEVLARVPREEVSWGAEQVGFASCLALMAARRLSEAWRLAERGYQKAVADRARIPAGGWVTFRGVVEKAQGRVATARTSLHEAVALLQDADPYRIRRACLAKLAAAAALAGDVEPAEAWLARADEEKDEPNRLFAPWVEEDRAWVTAARGRLSEAVEQSMRAADLARDSDQPTHEAVVLYDAARLGAPHLVAPRLEELAGVIEGGFVPALAAAASALCTADGAAMDQAATALEDLGMPLLAAELAVAAAGCHRQAGLVARATAAGRRAAILVSGCEGARTPMLRPVELGAPLTTREREVVMLAASGQRSREIAAHLKLSTRTVNNYLGRAYTKLGVTGRHELAELFDITR